MNNLKKYIESGRSMVEILGVLAVAGVLSIGGISGYRFAMDKYRANDIANEVNLRNRDTWYRYQTQDLPLDEDIIGEWSNTTPTGFPISVVPRSRLMFDVWVDEVPSKVCKNVLNMNIVGPLFVWTTNDDGATRHLYDGTNPEICGNEETKSLVFTTTLEEYNEEGLREDLTDPFNRPIRHCLEESDCRKPCETCHDRDPYTCNSTCPDETPICRFVRKLGEQNIEGECVECEITSDCKKGEVCEDITHKCKPLQKVCPDNTYRSKNGACVPCTDSSTIIVSDKAFQTSDDVFDEKPGTEQCLACEGHRLEYDTANEVIYCAVGCVNGLSYQSDSEGCIPCRNSDGTLNTTMHKLKRNDTKAKEQCVACGLDWYTYYYHSECRGPFYCTSDQFWGGGSNISELRCIDCTTNSAISLGWNYGSNVSGYAQKQIDSCKACPEVNSKGVHSSRRVKNGSCWPTCEQPEEGSEGDVSCASESEEERKKCTRQWQNSDGTCFLSNSTTGSTKVGSDTELVNLCKKAGREVSDEGYCVRKGNACGLGSFMTINGECISCTRVEYNYAFQIASDAKSGCTANCKKKDGVYSIDEDAVSTRWVYTSGNNQYCHKFCPSDQWQNGQGWCFNCSAEPLMWYVGGLGTKYCDDVCPASKGENQRAMNNGSCLFVHCPNKNNEKRWKERFGTCRQCSQSSSETPRSTDDCHWCDNRIHIKISGYTDGNGGQGMCALINPGVSGICNDAEDTTLPDNVSEEIREKVETYLESSQSKTKFRDINGYCYSCSEPATKNTTAAQCAVCINERRYNNGVCSLGQCDDGVEFLNSSQNCIKCSASFNYANSQIKQGKEYLCESCSERRVMTTVSDSYCVPRCSNNQWQDVTGVCRSDNTVREIGTDSISRQLCRDAGHIAYSKLDSNEKEHWYCSNKPEKDKFININGANVSCSSTERIQIPTTNDAQNLCRGTGDIVDTDVGCAFGQRTVIGENEPLYCDKYSE